MKKIIGQSIGQQSDGMGHQLSLIGMDRATRAADATHGDWSERAWAFLVAYGTASKGKPFLAEDVRHASINTVPAPPDGRAWENVFHRAAKGSLIRRIGFAPMRSPNCHANPKSVWVWVG